MKLLKNKKFWAITLGVTLVGAGVVAVAASCSSSNVKSKLSSQLVKSKDEKSFYAVYDIENFDDLTENDKKALNEAEFNVAITSAENKTENATTKGHLLNKKIYVKLPREPKAKEQLTIINKGGLLKTASLVLPDNFNYQTEKVDFENAPTPTPEPTPTPTPKEDKAIVSNVEFSEVNAQTKTAKVKLTFASAVQLKDESQKSLKLTLTKDSETKEVDLVLSQDKLSATADLNVLNEGTYKVTKLTLNGNEVSLNDEIKNKELKVEASKKPETGSTEGGSTEGKKPETGSTEGGTTEGKKPETGSTEGGTTEGKKPETGSTEGGSTEGKKPETGSTEGGSTEK
ncbi:multiple banded antigen [Ureaplasma urealyticum serovar 9 str. ATCC 33175]|nr:multiple banded antigen [Ureaplasma urealyticum serovar 9 str. ATCC 33175]